MERRSFIKVLPMLPVLGAGAAALDPTARAAVA